MTNALTEKRASQAMRWEWNVPIALTMVRFVLVPAQVYFITHGEILWAVYAYALAAVSDLFDGYLARKLNQRTPLGAALDPLADKITIMAMFIALVWIHVLPVFLVVLVLARDILILVGVFLLLGRHKRIPWKAIPIGKLTTAFQNATVLAGILKHFYRFPDPFFWTLVWITADLTVLSWFAYVRVWFRIDRAKL